MKWDKQGAKQEAAIERGRKEILRKEKLRQEVIGFLDGQSKKYSAWITITTRRSVSQENFEKQLRKFFHKLNNGRIEFYKKYVDLLLAYEKNTKGRKGVHGHGLVSNIDPKRFTFLWKRLFDRFGECKVEAIHDGVVPYIAGKYVEDTSLEHFMHYRIHDHRSRKAAKQRQDSHA